MATIAGSLVYLSFRVRVIYELQRDLVTNKIAHEQLQTMHDAQLAEVKARLDALERVLFGDVLAELSKKPLSGPSRIELWQQNRDKELRDRILANARAIIRLENEVEKLRDILR